MNGVSMEDISWSVMDIGDHIENNTFDCLMYGEDEEGNEYTGIATVIDPHNNPVWDEVTDVEKE